MITIRKLLFSLIFFSYASIYLAQTAEIVPGDNLVAEGIPIIPASLVEDVSRYTRGRSAGLLGWHPVSAKLLVATNRLVYIADTSREFSRRGADTAYLFDDNISTAFPTSEKRQILLFSRIRAATKTLTNYHYDFQQRYYASD